MARYTALMPATEARCGRSWQARDAARQGRSGVGVDVASWLCRSVTKAACVAIVAVLCIDRDAAFAESAKNKLLFAANARGRWELFSYELGRVPIRLTADAHDARAPAVSPDAKRVSYVRSDGSLWILDLVSLAARKVLATFSNGNGRYGFPTWINNDEFAYTTYVVTPPTEDSDIYVYSFKQGRQRVLVRQTGAQDLASVSPGGGSLAYVSSVTTVVTGFGSTITQQMWVASLRTGNLDQLVAGAFRDTRPAWSPDGKKIAFASDRNGGRHVWVVDVESKALEQVTSGPGDDVDPTWSPDGRQIAFVSTSTAGTELRVVDVASRRVSVLKPFGSRNVAIREPVWSK